MEVSNTGALQYIWCLTDLSLWWSTVSIHWYSDHWRGLTMCFCPSRDSPFLRMSWRKFVQIQYSKTWNNLSIIFRCSVTLLLILISMLWKLSEVAVARCDHSYWNLHTNSNVMVTVVMLKGKSALDLWRLPSNMPAKWTSAIVWGIEIPCWSFYWSDCQ